MKLTLNLKSFISEFVDPVTEVNKDGKTAIFIADGKINTICALKNYTVYLYNEFTPISIENPIERFNVNLAKLSKALLLADPGGFVTLEVDGNNIKYVGNNMFVIKQIDSNLINIPKFNINILKNMDTVFETSIGKNRIKDLKIAIDVTKQTEKFYIENIDGKIYIMFGDKLQDHQNITKVLINDQFTGEISENVYNTSILNLILKENSDIILKTSSNNALLMQVKNEFSTLNYLTPLLKK